MALGRGSLTLILSSLWVQLKSKILLCLIQTVVLWWCLVGTTSQSLRTQKCETLPFWNFRADASLDNTSILGVKEYFWLGTFDLYLLFNWLWRTLLRLLPLRMFRSYRWFLWRFLDILEIEITFRLFGLLFCYLYFLRVLFDYFRSLLLFLISVDFIKLY